MLTLLCFIVTGREFALLCVHKEKFKFMLLSLLFLNNGSSSALPMSQILSEAAFPFNSVGYNITFERMPNGCKYP